MKMAKKIVKQDKGVMKAYLKMIVGILLSITILAYAAISYGQSSILETGLVALVTLTLAIFFAYQGFKDLKSVEAGLPTEDERSRKVLRFAAANAFYISLYWLLAIMMFEDDLGIKDPGAALGLGILGMAVAFALAWVYGNSKEDLE